MERFRWGFIAVFFLLVGQAAVWTGNARAEEDDFLIAIGGSYSFVFEDSQWHSKEWWGGNLKIGYFAARNASIQIDVHYVPDVETGFAEETDIYSAMLSAKGYFPDMKRIRFSVVRPFVIAGIGGIRVSYPDDEEITEFGYKLGLGMDFVLARHFSLWVEGNYTRGIERLKELEMINTLAGFAINF